MHGFRFYLVILVAVLSGACATAPDSAKPVVPAAGTSDASDVVTPVGYLSGPEARKLYMSLKTQLLAGDLGINFSKFRSTYTAMPYYQPYGGDAVEVTQEAWRAYKQGEHEKCLELIESIEDSGLPLLNTHYVGEHCAEQLGREEKAQWHYELGKRIYFSIVKTDGKTPQTAWETLSTKELYLILFLEKLESAGQSLYNEDGKIFDLMEVRPMDDEDAPLEERYFDITLQMTRGMDNEGVPAE